MNIYLTKIKIENYKSIKKLELDLTSNSNGLEKDIMYGRFKAIDNGKYGLPAYIAIFGRNGIGKTSIISALGLICNLYNGIFSSSAMENVGGMLLSEESVGDMFSISNNSLVEMTRKRTEIVTRLKEEVNKRSGEYYSRYQAELFKMFKAVHKFSSNDKNKKIQLSLELIVDGKYIDYMLELSSDGIMDVKINNSDKQIIDSISQYFSKISLPSFDFPISDDLERFSSDRTLSEDVVSVSNMLVKLRDVIGEDKLNKLIRLADPNVTKVSFVTSNGVTVADRVFCGSTPIRVMGLSSGTRRFLVLATHILQPLKNGTKLVIFDEIEISLHKELIDGLKMMMVDMFEKHDVQYIFTSHSPLVIEDYMSFKQVYTMSIDANGFHIVEKLSKNFKPHQNPTNIYLNGDLANYPDPELLRNTLGEILN